MTKENFYPNDNPKEAAKKSAKDFRNKEKKNKNNDKKKEESVPEYATYKYSRPFLYEAVILDGLPSFISYAPKFDRILPYESVKEPGRILRPPNREEYPYTPYEFKDEQELEYYFRRARSENIDSLYQKAKSIVRRYNDQDGYKLNLLAIDVIWSYFQDKFGTTHYVGIVGDNDSGKTSIGNTFEAVAYRAVNMTSPTAPNVFRTLGKIEPGQCTLILDEADKIDESVDMMNILKAGYEYDKKVPKTNTNSWKVEWFYAYGLKIVIAEKSLSRFKAKGLLDRTLTFNTTPGETQLNIKEVTNPRGDPKLEQALSELIDFKKLMMVYRLIHFEDPVIDLDIGIERRNRELCKPHIRLFYGSSAQTEIEETFQTFIDIKNSRKTASIEAILIPVLMDLVDGKDRELKSSEVWDFIKEKGNLDGEAIGPDEYRISEYTLYRNTITKLLEDKFSSEYKHTNKGGKITFRYDKLQKIERSYYSEVKILTKPKSDGSDSSDGSLEEAGVSEDNIPVKNIEISQDNNENNVNIQQNQGLEDIQVPHVPSHMPSLPSLPSPSSSIEVPNGNGEDKAAMLKEYDRLSKLSRKNSKAAAKG